MGSLEVDLGLIGFLPSMGGWEWVILFAIILILFSRRLPELGRSIGRTIVEFQKGFRGEGNGTNDSKGSEDPPGRKE